MRRRSVEALGLSGARYQASLGSLGDALADEQEDVRLHAIVALGRVGPRAAEYASAIAAFLSQPSTPTRVLALETLGRIR